MSRLTVSAFTVSIDGYGAGPNQDRENPPEMALGHHSTLLRGVQWIDADLFHLAEAEPPRQ